MQCNKLQNNTPTADLFTYVNYCATALIEKDQTKHASESKLYLCQKNSHSYEQNFEYMYWHNRIAAK